MDDSSTTAVTVPETVRRLRTPDAKALADLTAVSEELATVAGCCEQILTLSGQQSTTARTVLVEALWTAALVSYRRCFSTGEETAGLSADDLADTNLRGDVRQWHNTLERLREHYVDTRANPSEGFVAGIARDAEGNPNGIAVTSAPRPQPDETTVRQTGQLAPELGRIVDERIKSHQESVYAEARSMTPHDLAALPEIHISPPESAEHDARSDEKPDPS